MPNIALLALEASDAGVVVTSILLVFSMLVALCLIITLEGKVFSALNEKKNKPAPPQFPAAKNDAAAAPKAAPTVPAAAPASAPAPVAGGIPGEIIAAIAAAVVSLEGEGAVVRSIRRVAKRAAGASRRGAWGDAGVHEHTTPFM